MSSHKFFNSKSNFLLFLTASLIKALAEEKRLSQFSNTESEAEDKKQREYKRKHPVHSQNTQNPINLNEHFNKIKDGKWNAALLNKI